MATELSSHQFTDVYESLGVDLQGLGCIMLDVNEIDVSHIIDPEDLYVSDKYTYVKGLVSNVVPHCTLLYGLMNKGSIIHNHVDRVLEGWSAAPVTIEKVGFFYSQVPDESWITIIAELVVSSNLMDAHTRLSMLPHINTFPTYKPHITLAYVKQSSDFKQYVDTINAELAGLVLDPVGINYGA